MRARRDAQALVRRALLGWLHTSLGAAFRGWAAGAARRAHAQQLVRKVWSSYGRPEAKALHTWRDNARTRGETRRHLRLALGRAMRPEAHLPIPTLTLPLPLTLLYP